MGFHDNEILLVLHGLGLALMMGRLAVLWPGLWAFIEENRLDRPKSSFLGLSLMVHVSLGLSFGPS